MTSSSSNVSLLLLCPCANVRRTCAVLLQEDEDWTMGGPRGVRINDEALSALANQIITQQQDNQQEKQQQPEEKQPKKDHQSPLLLLTTWDEHEWHYTGRNYRGGTEQDRRERVALSILAIDAINFCFWPLPEESSSSASSLTTDDDNNHNNIPRLHQNRIEYEHLAKTLNYMAQRDDNYKDNNGDNGNEVHDDASTIPPRASPNFIFSPTNLANMTVETMTRELQDAWNELLTRGDPAVTSAYPKMFLLQNMKERCRLWNELGTVLLTHFQGSATLFLQQGLTSSSSTRHHHQHHDDDERVDNAMMHCCASSLVQSLIQHFTGYRDEAVDDYRGRWICFYKRAQICVADLHGALDLTTFLVVPPTPFDSATISSINNVDDEHQQPQHNNNNMHVLEALTTFADYRVPQYLRHVHVLEYSPSLAACIDQGHELPSRYHDDNNTATVGTTSGRMQELYIRAATVVVAQRLVQECRRTMNEEEQQGNLVTASMSENHATPSYYINDVLVDWYLWQLGEGMLAEMKPHHRVRTIYY